MRSIELFCATDPRPRFISTVLANICLKVSRVWSCFSSALPLTLAESITLNPFCFSFLPLQLGAGLSDIPSFCSQPSADLGHVYAQPRSNCSWIELSLWLCAVLPLVLGVNMLIWLFGARQRDRSVGFIHTPRRAA